MTASLPVRWAYEAAEKAAWEARQANAPDVDELQAKAEVLYEALAEVEAAEKAAHQIYVEEADVEVRYPVPGDNPRDRETWHWCKRLDRDGLRSW